jgi:UDP-glucose 4-epimerase
MSGFIEHLVTVKRALNDVTYVSHLATCKEIPDQIMDVAIKGLFWLLETCRTTQPFNSSFLSAEMLEV